MDYKAHIDQLRKLYIEATPRQRLNIAIQRINNPERGPNLLIAYVSALEGFSRCLVLHQQKQSKKRLPTVYPTYRNMSIEQLITEYLEKKINSDPLSFFGQKSWEMIGFAVKYRNLLAHECTYLGQDRYPELIAECKQALNRLADLEGLEFNPI